MFESPHWVLPVRSGSKVLAQGHGRGRLSHISNISLLYPLLYFFLNIERANWLGGGGGAKRLEGIDQGAKRLGRKWFRGETIRIHCTLARNENTTLKFWITFSPIFFSNDILQYYMPHTLASKSLCPAIHIWSCTVLGIFRSAYLVHRVHVRRIKKMEYVIHVYTSWVI